MSEKAKLPESSSRACLQRGWPSAEVEVGLSLSGILTLNIGLLRAQAEMSGFALPI